MSLGSSEDLVGEAINNATIAIRTYNKFLLASSLHPRIEGLGGLKGFRVPCGWASGLVFKTWVSRLRGSGPSGFSWATRGNERA